MSIPLKLGTDGNLKVLSAGESLQADLFERLSGSGNLLVGSLLSGTDELRLGSATATTVAMKDLKVGGSSGPRIRNNGGVVEVRNSADAAFAVVRVGEPTGDNANDAVTNADFLLRNYPVQPGVSYSNTFTGNRVTQEQWRRSSDNSLIKQVEYTFTGSRVTSEVRKLYAANGTTIIAQITNTYTYVGQRLTGQTTTRDV